MLKSPPAERSSSNRLQRGKQGQLWVRVASSVTLLFFFLLGIRALAVGFEGLGAEAARTIFGPASNPIVALAIGVLATSLVQSSSVSTSMIVTFAAVPNGGLPLESAIPMVMGANIGTTVTNSLVALGYFGRRAEFSRALAAATCHDIFNVMVVAALLPLELLTGVLERTSASIASAARMFSTGYHLPNPIGAATDACVRPVESALLAITDSERLAYGIVLLIAAVLIYTCLVLLMRPFRDQATSGLKSLVMSTMDTHPGLNMATGALTTAIIQSSSATTSVLVPLAAAGVIRLQHAFMLTLGANVGTTMTALLASLAAPRETAGIAVQVAVVHLLFNLVGVLLVYPHPKLRQVPIKLAERFAGYLAASRRRALAYLLLLYYGLPAAIILA